MNSDKVKNTKNYQNGKIYCIRNSKTNDYYIGSTCQSLSRRMSHHRSDAKKQRMQHSLIYSFMLKHGYEHFYIELIEECPCENKHQLDRREGELIRELKPSLNKNIAGRTRKEWREEHVEELKQLDKNKYIKNKDKYIEYSRQYREEYKEEIKEKKKEYYLNNIEVKREKGRKYRDNNLEEVRRKQREAYHRKKEQKQITPSENGDTETQETIREMMKNNS